MLAEIDDLHEQGSSRLIAGHESALLKIGHECVNIAIVVRQNFRLKLLRSPLKPPFPIGVTPETGKEEPSQWLTFAERVIREKARLDVPRARHA